MKKYTLIIALFLYSIAQPAFAQKSFEGRISYQFSSAGTSSSMKFPAEYTVYYKGNKCKNEIKSANDQPAYEMIIDIDSARYTILYKNIKGENYAVTDKQKNDFSENSSAVTFFDATKTISGYACKKAIITSKDFGTMEIYYTKEIGSKAMNSNTPFFQIDGTVLEETVTLQDGSKYKATATAVNQAIPDNIFSIPASFKRINLTQWNELKINAK